MMTRWQVYGRGQKGASVIDLDIRLGTPDRYYYIYKIDIEYMLLMTQAQGTCPYYSTTNKPPKISQFYPVLDVHWVNSRVCNESKVVNRPRPISHPLSLSPECLTFFQNITLQK